MVQKEIHIIKQLHKENIKKSVEELMWLSRFYANRKRLDKAMDSYFVGFELLVKEKSLSKFELIEIPIHIIDSYDNRKIIDFFLRKLGIVVQIHGKSNQNTAKIYLSLSIYYLKDNQSDKFNEI